MQAMSDMLQLVVIGGSFSRRFTQRHADLKKSLRGERQINSGSQWNALILPKLQLGVYGRATILTNRFNGLGF